MANQIIYPMATHILWTALLYILLTIMRAPTIWNIGALKDGTNPWTDIEHRVSANLSNQFEWPVFFHLACIVLLIDENLISTTYVLLAWVFMLGRLSHSVIQIMTNNIRLRGVIFTINFLAVIGIWALLIIDKVQINQ